MATGTCPNCGAPLKPGGQYCAYCGTAVAQPLSSSQPTYPPPSMGGPPPLSGSPASRRSKNRAIVIVVVVVLVIAGGIGVYFYYLQSQVVDVNVFLSYSHDNACGLGAYQTVWNGFNDTPSAVDSFQFTIPNYNVTSCTLRGVTTNTSGFSISGVQLPGPIPGSPNPLNPNVGYLNLTLSIPGSPWSGNVNLVFA